MKLFLLFISFNLLFSSCSSPGFESRSLKQYFVSSGVTRYFLPDVPDWANFSESASCHRKQQVRYFDMKNLRESFSLNYPQSVHFQNMFNVYRYELLESSSLDSLPPKEEEKVFYTVSEKVQSNLYHMAMPKFQRVHLIWIDPLTKDLKGTTKLKRKLNSEEMMQGHPVFISLCMSYHEMNNFLVHHHLTNFNIKLISYEFFSLYDENKEMETFMGLNIRSLFQESQKLYLYLPTKEKPKELKGEFNVKYF